jgi:peptidoglycan LD-endopeptidase LytH
MHSLEEILVKHEQEFAPIVPFDSEVDRLYPFDFTDSNKELSQELVSDTEKFSAYITQTIKRNQCRYGIGGYNEHRTLYSSSKHFDRMIAPAGEGIWEDEGEPRRLHLGIDIWGESGTKVMSPLDGIVHSFAFNNHFGDYGATIILTHNLEGLGFQTLYGHLSLNSLKNLHEGKRVFMGEVFTEFGMRFENGHWPPHLHFQLIRKIGEWQGDYPGVCAFSEREKWLTNSPDPAILLGLI